MSLMHDLLTLMLKHNTDYTNTFRQLCAVADGDTAPAGYEAWVGRWLARLARESHARQATATLMRAHHPAVIPRHHRVEAALNAAVQPADFAPLETLLAVLPTPFMVRPEYADYSNPPAPSERVYQTFCGT